MNIYKCIYFIDLLRCVTRDLLLTKGFSGHRCIEIAVIAVDSYYIDEKEIQTFFMTLVKINQDHHPESVLRHL